MFRFGKSTDSQEQFVVNKGNVKVVSEGDYKIAYDKSLAGHVEVSTSADTVRIEVSKDIPNSSIYVNSKNIEDCKVFVGAGNLEVNTSLPNATYKVGNGNLDAKLEKSEMGLVKAKVCVGVVSNTSDLAKVEAQDFLPSFDFNPFMPTGFNNIELTGEVEGSTASFEVQTGTINLHE